MPVFNTLCEFCLVSTYITSDNPFTHLGFVYCSEILGHQLPSVFLAAALFEAFSPNTMKNGHQTLTSKKKKKKAGPHKLNIKMAYAECEIIFYKVKYKQNKITCRLHALE